MSAATPMYASTASARLEGHFARHRKGEGGTARKTLVAYLCVGDPSLEESLELARACIRAGADILELGVPFSDPTADGPAIARASQRAIARGGGFEATLRVARALRDGTRLGSREPSAHHEPSDVPLVLFGYYNPIFVRGDARAVREAHDAGIDGLLIVDLPLEEGRELREAAAASGVAVVPLLAPTSQGARIAALKASAAKWPAGFVYYVSVTGVTGSADAKAAEAGTTAAKLRDELGLPVVVGFGIDSREKARAAAVNADGVVVGTALVRAIEQGANAEDRIARVTRLVAELREGVDAAAL